MKIFVASIISEKGFTGMNNCEFANGTPLKMMRL